MSETLRIFCRWWDASWTKFFAGKPVIPPTPPSERIECIECNPSLARKYTHDNGVPLPCWKADAIYFHEPGEPHPETFKYSKPVRINVPLSAFDDDLTVPEKHMRERTTAAPAVTVPSEWTVMGDGFAPAPNIANYPVVQPRGAKR